jgi:hypothetical protein
MDIAEESPCQLAPTVGTTGSGSTGSLAPSPVVIDSPSLVAIDSPSSVAIDSPSSAIINFYPHSSRSASLATGGFSLTIGMLNFHVDDADVSRLLPTVEITTSTIDSASPPPAIIQKALAVDSAL